MRVNRRDLLRMGGVGAALAGTGTGAAMGRVSASRPPEALSFDERLLEARIDQSHAAWERTGLLDGIEREADRRTVSLVLEHQRIYNQHATGGTSWQPPTPSRPDVLRISIPVVRRALGAILGEGWLPLHPIAGPTGLIYYRRIRPLASTEKSPRVAYHTCIESESVACSTRTYGPAGWDPPYPAEPNPGLDAEAEAIARLAQELADQILGEAALELLSQAGTRGLADISRVQCGSTSGLTVALGVRDAIARKTFQGQRPGYFWALVPKDPWWDPVAEGLARERIRVARRDIAGPPGWDQGIDAEAPHQPLAVVLVGFRGESRGDNGYFSLPYVPVTQANPPAPWLVARWGQRLLPQGGNFYGAVKLGGPLLAPGQTPLARGEVR